MKDPAFLFYPGDWLGGTMGMTIEQKGAYMELLLLQFNNKHFTIDQVKQVLNICFASAWRVVKLKFETEGETNEFFYNKRLREEIEKRKSFTESRRLNGLGKKKTRKHKLKHMEDENEDENKKQKNGAKNVIYPSIEEVKKDKNEEEIKQCNLVIFFLNEKVGTDFKTGEGHLKHIRARLKEGFSVEDLKKVIEFKTSQWKNDIKMEKYLRPSTLFNSEKCDGYLQEAKRQTATLPPKSPKPYQTPARVPGTEDVI